MTIPHMKQLLGYLSLALLAACSQDKQDGTSTWPTFGHDVSNNKFSALTDIDTSNVMQLQEVWRYEDTTEGGGVYFNPVMMGNRVIGLMPSNTLVALDAVTGKLLWVFVPDSSAIPNWSKGITYHPGNPDRIFLISGDKLYAINAENGTVIKNFGNNGRVDFYEGLEVPDSMRMRVPVSSNAPGVVYNDLFIVGCKVPDELPSTPGDIRAFNINTGKLEWVFHVIPKPGEFGADTWNANARQRNGGANCWAGMALDEKRGIVFVPTASPSFDFYAADRPGQNLFANCLLALDARTGKRLWHFQTVHHDLWDYDNVSAPQLVTVRHNGQRVDGVALAGKTGFLYVFNRVTGAPLWPIEERPVPKSDVPGEQAWPTQPFPTRPAPFARLTFTVDDLNPWLNTPEQYAAMKERVSKARNEGLFTPPAIIDTISMPGNQGGSNWASTAANPQKGLVFVVNVNQVAILRLEDVRTRAVPEGRGGGAPLQTGFAAYQQYCGSCHGAN